MEASEDEDVLREEALISTRTGQVHPIAWVYPILHIFIYLYIYVYVYIYTYIYIYINIYVCYQFRWKLARMRMWCERRLLFPRASCNPIQVYFAHEKQPQPKTINHKP